jgi:hypothetical protein
MLFERRNWKCYNRILTNTTLKKREGKGMVWPTRLSKSTISWPTLPTLFFKGPFTNSTIYNAIGNTRIIRSDEVLVQDSTISSEHGENVWQTYCFQKAADGTFKISLGAISVVVHHFILLVGT